MTVLYYNNTVDSAVLQYTVDSGQLCTTGNVGAVLQYIIQYTVNSAVSTYTTGHVRAALQYKVQYTLDSGHLSTTEHVVLSYSRLRQSRVSTLVKLEPPGF